MGHRMNSKYHPRWNKVIIHCGILDLLHAQELSVSLKISGIQENNDFFFFGHFSAWGEQDTFCLLLKKRNGKVENKRNSNPSWLSFFLLKDFQNLSETVQAQQPITVPFFPFY